VAHGGLAHGALEQEHLVGQRQCVAMVEIDLDLRRAGLVGQRVDVDFLRRAIIVDVLEDRIELVDRVDAIGLAAALGPAGASDRRHQRIIGIGVDLDQEELQLGRHDRLPALGGIQLQHPLQHEARRDIDGGAVGIDAVADHLGGRLLVPGHQRIVDPSGIM
jgi:hypothetical protein